MAKCLGLGPTKAGTAPREVDLEGHLSVDGFVQWYAALFLASPESPWFSPYGLANLQVV